MDFTTELALWYEHHGRDLPWRETRNAYYVWLSEIILQQTTVLQGTDYYLRFIHRFPTIEDLAHASEDEVLRLWQGLGYYTRARNLYAAAQKAVAAGKFPDTYAGLLELPGVGRYTAAAVASIAYGLPHAVVDGNVYRILARYFCIDTPIDTTQGQKEFAALAQELLDTRAPGRHNQAMMDFGATQCTPHTPHCDTCPLAASCLAHARGLTSSLPAKARQMQVKEVQMNYVLVHTQEGLYLRQRPKKGIWGGLWELVSEGVEGTQEIGVFHHQLTHRSITCHASALRLPDTCTIPDYNFVRWEDLDQYALPRLIEHIINSWKRKNFA